MEDDELDAIAIESTHTIAIDTFVPREQIDQRYLDSPYYITPNGRTGREAFAVIREAMRGKSMAALGRIVLAKRERVIAIEPWDKGLVATTLRYPYEIRNEKDYFDEIPDVELEPEMLQLAERILQGRTAGFDPSQFVDRYEEAVVEMLRRKQLGIPSSRKHGPSRSQNTVNLMEALRRSIDQGERARSIPPKRIKRQSEMRPSNLRKMNKQGPVKPMGRATVYETKAG